MNEEGRMGWVFWKLPLGPNIFICSRHNYLLNIYIICKHLYSKLCPQPWGPQVKKTDKVSALGSSQNSFQFPHVQDTF